MEREQLHRELSEAMMGPPATAMGEIFEYLIETDSLARSASTDSATLIALTNVQEYIIKPQLRTVPGVADVNTWGGMLQQYQVNADPAKLAGFGLTIRDLATALSDNNANFGAGYVEDRGERLTVRGLGRVSDTADVANVVLATRGGTPVHVRDVATVSIDAQPRFGAVTRADAFLLLAMVDDPPVRGSLRARAAPAARRALRVPELQSWRVARAAP